MGLLGAAFNPTPKAGTPGPLDDFWYTRDVSGYIVERGGAGLSLSADTILRCGTVLAAVRFRGDSWAMCPPSTYRKTAKGREELPNHYSQVVLRNPNPWMTGNRWRHLNGVWMATWGNAYNEIRSRGRSFADELWPMHPSRVRLVDQREDGSLLYEYRRPDSEKPELMGQEKVLHFRDISTDGFSGLEMYRLVRNVAGIALLAEQHVSTFLKKGARIAGLLVPANPLKKEDRDALRESVNADFGGTSATGSLGILPHGIELKPLSLSNRDNQSVELADQVVGMILRFLGVPGVVVGWAEKTATYASAKEFFESGGIKHCVLPILVNVEDEEQKALLPDDSGLQIKHNLDALLRANLKDRYDSYGKALGGAPWLSVNDVRSLEDWNAVPDPRHDEIRIPANLTPSEPAPEPEPQMPEPPPRRPQGPSDPDETPVLPPAVVADARLHELARAFAHDNASRVVAFEVSKARTLGQKHARDKDRFRAAVLELYGAHAAHVAKAMRISEVKAHEYCARQASALLAGGLAVVEAWGQDIPPQLAALALEGE